VTAHTYDLRVEVKEAALADALEQNGWESAPLEPAERALCAYAQKLTKQPEDMVETDVQTLREAGWSDLEIQDACQVVAYFNYINRIADGLGVAPEKDLPPA